jgi:hypothetical protein
VSDEKLPPPDHLLDAFASLVRRNVKVRDALRVLASEFLAFLSLAEEGDGATAEPVAELQEGAVKAGAAASPPAPSAAAVPEPIVELKRELQHLRIGGIDLPVEVVSDSSNRPHGFVGPTVVEPPPEPLAEGLGRDVDLSLVIERCRLKVEACRWAVDRRRRMAGGEDYRTFGDGYRDLVARAKSMPDCYLWMIPADAQLPSDEVMGMLAGCYAAVAEGAELVLKLVGADEPDAPLAGAFQLLAEAQSALRAGLLPVLDYREDFDQRDVFWWLRTRGYERQLFIERYMRVDDPADPNAYEDVRRRIGELREAWEQRHRRDRDRRNVMGKIRYQASKTARSAGDPSAAAEWHHLGELVDQAVGLGLQPNYPELRSALLPLEGQVPDDVAFGAGMQAALEQVDRFVAATEQAGGDDAGAAAESSAVDRQWGADVRRVAELLRGKKMMLVGGYCRAQSQRALERAFELDEVIWPSTGRHASLTIFEPDVAKPSVAVVVMAIRWSSHSYGELKSLCDKYDKPFVRLKAGYNPSQVAKAIWEQAGIELTKRADVAV